MLKPNDDLRHDLEGNANAQESLLGNILIPDENFYSVVHCSIAASGLARRIVAVFQGDDEPVLEVASEHIADDDDLSDTTFAGLRITQPDRLQTMTFNYQSDLIDIDYRFAGMHEAFDFAQCRDGAAPSSAANRFEQAGLIQGNIRVGDRKLNFNTTGERDHSWGPRNHKGSLHYKWLSAQAGPDFAVQATQTSYFGRLYLNGFVFKDGLLSPIADLKIRTHYDERILQSNVEFIIRDEAGHSIKGTGQRFAGGLIPAGIVNAEAAFRFEIDGQEGLGVYSNGWQADYLQYLQDDVGATIVGSLD